MKRLLLALMTLLPATAHAGELDRALGEMVSTTGASYVEARTRVQRFGEEALRARTAAWNDATWELDAAAAAALSWLERPNECARVYALEGLKPSVYLARRRRGPEVGRELRRLPDMAPIFYEALTKSLYRTSAPGDFPESVRVRAEQLIATERAALRIGLLVALGHSDHPLARFALARVVRDTSAAEGVRRAAAIAFGEAGGDVALLAALANDATLPRRLRAGAVIGIAKASSAHPRAGLKALRALLEDPTLQRPAISGLAIAGASWGAEPSAERDRLRAEIAVLLAERIAAISANEDALIEALTVVDHPIARERLERLREDPNPAVRTRAERTLRRLRPAAR